MQCPLEQLQKCVLEAVENFTRGARQADDVTVLIGRYRAAATSATTNTDVPSAASSSASARLPGDWPSRRCLFFSEQARGMNVQSAFRGNPRGHQT